jgi:hypothetical protein
MRYPFIPCLFALVSTFAAGTLHAQSLPTTPLAGVITAAPMPHSLTTYPASDADAPAYRAGGALDAGPMNATPFSASGSISLTSTLAGRELNASRSGGFMPSIGAE